ncbi:MAG: NADH-quinone oxidoreductase subunit L [Acidobacteria bacterium]|nr:MAG: NADH-quinone oxidoreductase subunit L [Acidobacteriota bacterium]PYV04083.1 MAG: NADH-quinone oxidoreductase subunit L [Acidobacteriota bacterium]PYV39067.1 MAG: NADH-quinone oxidoreductase subunit L [Acidobacteriota bacterium]
MLDKIWLIPLVPLAGSAIAGLAGLINLRLTGQRLDRRLVSIIALSSVGLAFLLSAGAVFELFSSQHKGSYSLESYSVDLFTWFEAGSLPVAEGGLARFTVPWGFLLDPLSAVMILVVTGVGFLIHVYSTGYMWDDSGYYRFFSYLNLFMFAMLTLVLANNFVLMFVGWEGVGLCSYLLIGYYLEKKSAGDAGKKAFVVNRIGDAGFILGMFLIFVHFGSLRYDEVFSKAAEMPVQAGHGFLFWATLCLFIGATGKSAQVPLYVWLPDAMEGPTPVSALIHAATMVTAGVYMVARCNALYSRSPETMTIIATIGALTAVFAATIGFAQTDIKRVLAYSTVSQLGYMFAALGVGAFAGGIFHLMTHAFFKALLFLGSGAVIMAMHHEQDMRKMGGLRKHLPATYQTMLIGTLAIAGVPGLAGFFSKDEILWKAWSNGHPRIWFALWLGAGMTAFYMFRLIFLTFWGEERMDEDTKRHLHEPGSNVIGPLVVLAFLSVVGGYVGLPAWLGGSKFERFLEPVLRLPENPALAEAHHPARQEILFTFLSVAIAAAGIFLAHYCYVKNPSAPEKALGWWPALHRLVYRKYYVDEIYDALFVNRAKDLANACFFVDSKFVDGAVNGTAATTRGTAAVSGFFDKYVVDGLVNLIGWINMMLNRVATSLQTGLIQRYALGAVFGIVVFILIYFNGLLNF